MNPLNITRNEAVALISYHRKTASKLRRRFAHLKDGMKREEVSVGIAREEHRLNVIQEWIWKTWSE